MSVTLLDEKYVIARKWHRCCACLGVIAVGDRYLRQSVADNGRVGAWQAHALCEKAYWIAHAEAALFPDEEVDPSEVAEVVERFFAAIAAPCIDRAREDGS